MTDAPVYLAPLDREFVPHKYLIFAHSQRCDSCGSTHEWSEIYGETRLRATMGHGYITNRRPAHHMTQIQYNLPIETRQLSTTVPFCHKCLRPQMLSHLPKPPVPVKTPQPSWIGSGNGSKQSHWQDKKENWHEPDVEDYATTGTVKVKKPGAKAAKRTYTIDDI